MSNPIKLSSLFSIRRDIVDPRILPNEVFYSYSMPAFDTCRQPEIVQGSEIDSVKFVIDSGTLLISKLNPRIKRVWHVKNDGAFRSLCSTEFVNIAPKKPENAEFLFYLLSSEQVYRPLRRVAEGTTNSHIRFKPSFLDSIRLYDVPAETTWDVIASGLAVLDEVIKQTESLIASYQQIKAGLMHDLFTRGITSDGQLRPTIAEAPDLYQKSPLGWIPKCWEAKPLRDIAAYQHGQPFPSSEYSDEGVLLLRPGNLHASGIVRFDAAHTTRIPERWLREYPELVLKQDDIVMNLTAQSLEDQFLGRVCIVNSSEPSLLNQRIARFFPRNANRYYVYWLLRSLQFRNQIDRTTQGTKVQHIYNSDLNRVVLGIPKSPEEQERIHVALKAITDALLSNEQDVVKLRQQKQGLVHDLLTGRVPVSAE